MTHGPTGASIERTTREALIAILTATRTDAHMLDDGSYLDWSNRNGDAIELEVGDSAGKVVTLNLTRADVADIVHRMAATLLAD